MEKNKQNNQEDALMKKYFQEIELKQPTKNFTNNIMAVLAKEKKLSLVNNEPLISKKMWFLIALFVGSCVYFVFRNEKSSKFSFPSYDFNFISGIEIPNLLPSITISNAMVYIFGFFTLLFFIQVFYLKNYFEKRLKF